MFRIIRNHCFGSAWYFFFCYLSVQSLRPLTIFRFMDECGNREQVSWRFPNACLGSLYNAEPLLLSDREKREYLSKHSSRFPSRLFRGKQQVDLITCYDAWPGGLSLEMLSSYFPSWAVAFGSPIILPQPENLEVSPSAHPFPRSCWNALFPCHKILHCGFGGHLEWSNSAEPTFRNRDWSCKCSSCQGS